jgi:multiple sugar transport system permease protein
MRALMRRTSSGQLAAVAALTLMAVFFATPIIWALSEAIGGTALHWLLNSAFYSTAGALIAVACCIPAGYGLATHDFPGRRPLLIVTILVMLIPPNALVLPLFLEAHAAHLLSSPLAVILPYGFYPFGVYLAYLYFNTARFRVLLQTARTDGCSEWRVFRRIALPLSLPVAALITFLNFLASWTNFFLPWVMYWSFGTSGRYPLALGIALQIDTSTGASFYGSMIGLHLTSSPGYTAVLLLVTCAPVLIVLAIAQRWIGSSQLYGVFR